MKSTVLVRMLGVAFLVAAGCGSNTPAGISNKGGTSGGGAGGTTSSGSAGTSASGSAGTVGNGGNTAAGVGGNTAAGVGGNTAAGVGGNTAAGVGGNTAAGVGGNTSSGVGGNATGGSAGGGGTSGVGGSKVGNPQCSDGIDNDGDGKIDYDDPECVGPLDNDESSFATGIPGDNMDACKQDCFFDGNSGMGDDHCLWQLKCDPMSTTASCPYDPQFAAQHSMDCSLTASQSQQCIDSCRKLVPNGCDCFGCCVVPGAPTPIRLAATCTAANFGDPTKCPACTQVTQCSNPCEHCEICIGKPTLPADCFTTPDGGTGTDGGTDVPPPNNCGSDYVPCGPGTPTPADGCGPNYGCVTGCCIPTGI